MRDVYRAADKLISSLKKSINAEFHNVKNEIGFDALNIIQTRDKISDMFARLDTRNRKGYRKVFHEAYKEAQEDAELEGFTEKADADLDFDLAVYHVLAGYNPITEYKYTSEAKRKRDRLFESIIATEDSARRNNSINRGARLWLDQSEQYTDIVTDEGRRQGFEDSGVEFVAWVTQRDDRVCEECRDLDNQIFPIDQIPDKPHRRCRCTIRPVRRP